ncbi:MAG: hypothetical protein V7676_12690 [Parasphingorhabdus sp.]|uniref:hypothetical protein n=1 Tax=Parasphingorhabdus sp. TaxID=2709688 RepID=UPI003002367B
MIQERDHTLILEEIRQRLERLENQRNTQVIENIDMGQLSIDLRRARIGSFPDGYFTGSIWDVLLELYQARQSGRKIQLAEISANASIPEKVALRYIDLLMADGYLYQEEGPIDQGQPHLLLTNKAIIQIEKLFAQIQAKMLGVKDILEPQHDGTVIRLNKPSLAG